MAAAGSLEMKIVGDFLPSSPIRFLGRIGAALPKLPLVLSLSLSTLGQGLYVLLPGVIGLLINQIFTRSNWPVYSLMLFPAVWLLSIVILSTSKLCLSIVIQDVRQISKTLAFRHIIYCPSPIYITRDAGEIEHLVQELSFNSRYVFGESLVFFLRGLVTLVVSLFIVGEISRELAIVVLGWACMYLPLGYISAKRSVTYVADSLSSAAAVSAATVEVISNHELIPAFGTEQTEISRYDATLNQEKASFNKAQRKIDLSEFTQRCLQVLLPISVGFVLVFSGHLPKLGAGASASIFSSMLILAHQLGDFSKCLLAFLEVKERLGASLKRFAVPSTVNQLSRLANTIPPSTWKISFNDVTCNGPQKLDRGVSL